MSDFGRKIVLNLVYDYPGDPKQESQIEFSDVACHHFVHTDGAIITDIEEKPLNELVKDEEVFLTAAVAENGNRFWQSDASHFVGRLAAEGYRAWRLDSAIGFTGFVIAKAMLQKEEPNHGPEPTSPSDRG